MFNTIKECHNGAKEAFKIGKVSVWGCTSRDIDLVPEPFVGQISFSSDITEDEVKVNNSGRALFKRSVAYFRGIPSLPYMSIDWDDQAAPPVSFKFWKQLVSDLLEAKGNLIINCVGGHGRTGTALVCLAWAAHLVPQGEDAVKWLRSIYCEKAVESKKQLNYLKESGIYTEVAPPVYAITDDVWVKCTTCSYYASPSAVKECESKKLPIRCDNCTGSTAGSWYSDKDSFEFCDICNYSLTRAEAKHSKALGVSICKECEDKFGVDGLKDEKREDKGEKTYLESIMNAGYTLLGDKHDKPA